VYFTSKTKKGLVLTYVVHIMRLFVRNVLCSAADSDIFQGEAQVTTFIIYHDTLLFCHIFSYDMKTSY